MREGVARVFVFGGSQGALAINRLLPAALGVLPPGLRRYLEQPKVDRELTEKYRQPGYHPTHVSVGELQAGWAAAAPFHQPPLAASSYIKQQVTRFY